MRRAKPGHKICRVCHEEKPYSEFYLKSTKRGSSYYDSKCYICLKAYARRWNSANNSGHGHIKPPFYCPWASDGCKHVSWDKREHQAHIWTVHEIPGEIDRSIPVLTDLQGHRPR